MKGKHIPSTHNVTDKGSNKNSNTCEMEVQI